MSELNGRWLMRGALVVALLVQASGPARGQAHRPLVIEDVSSAEILRTEADFYWRNEYERAKASGPSALQEELGKEIRAREEVLAAEQRWLAGLAPYEAVTPPAAATRDWIARQQNLLVDLRIEAEALKMAAAAEQTPPPAAAEPRLPPPPLFHEAAPPQSTTPYVPPTTYVVEQPKVDVAPAPLVVETPHRHQRAAKKVSSSRADPPRHRSGVWCCDGTMSPTCTYAHRGCCSWHGGVCER